MEIQFILSPVGRFDIAYHIGEIAVLPIEFAKELIELGYAIETNSSKENSEIEMAVKEVKTEKKIKK
jgi:hypothetical protein